MKKNNLMVNPLRVQIRKARLGDIRSIYQLYLNYLYGEHVEPDSDNSNIYLKQLITNVQSSKIALKTVSFNDFRGFEDITLNLHRNLTVIIGNNGAGKSTILDGLAILLSWLRANILKEDRPGNGIRESDINNSSIVKSASISGKFTLSKVNFDIMIARAKDGASEKKNSELLGVKSLGGIYRHINENDNDSSMPLIAYYPVSRSNNGGGVDAKKRNILNKKEWSKFDAYEDIFSYRLDFGDFITWLITLDSASKQFNSDEVSLRILTLRNEAAANVMALESLESIKELDQSIVESIRMSLNEKMNEINELEAERNKKGPNVAAKTLSYIKDAFSTFLPNLQKMRVSYTATEISLLFDKNDVTLEVQQLSQGEKSILTLVGDIARRLVLLNPTMKNPLHGDGIVLIDEIDLHLHPVWQQEIIGNLQNVFPNIQMILTTHSPQVLSTVDASSIRIVDGGGDGSIKLRFPPYQTKGVLSADILSQTMFTNPKPKVKEAMWLDEYKEIIEDGELESEYASVLEQKLIKHFGKDHPLMLECDTLKSVRNMKIKLSARMNK